MKLHGKSLFRKFEKPVMIVASSAGMTALLMSLEFNLLEANLYDFRMAKGTQPQASSEIVLVTLDDETTRELDEFSPLPLDFHTRFIESLETIQPRGVGYLVDMNRVNQMNPLLFRDDWGTRFVDAATRMEARGIPVLMGTPFDVTGEVVPPYPLSALPHSIAIIHKDGNVFSEDKITRRALTYLYDKPVFHLELAQRLGLMKEGTSPRGSFYVPEVDGQYFFFRYHGNTVVTPGKSFKLPYGHISFAEVLKGSEKARQALQGKIVLVGSFTREDASDYAFTPFSKNSFTNPKLVVHANILDAVIHNDSIVRVPTWFNWVSTFSLTTFILWWVLNTSPLSGVFTTLGLATGFVVLGQALFSIKGWWIRESQPLVGIFLAYYLAVPYRLILEYKKRWDYQRKHEILIQVEEMKTNFLQLVTHDLKTPVARIQGLAEMLLRKSDSVSSDREKTLEHIIHSTDELNRFITSILELHKVESNRLQLNKESKDVNQLIERATENFRAQARSANITLQAELDPLFPIRVDTALIAKVINNLIDNALKYSPPGSKVTIRSFEENDWVVVSVTDQGIGMTEEEIENLFTRFYRAKNDTTTQVSGTGLGLYLTKDFVEAHHGKVEVVSASGKGSTFSIKLPLVSQDEKPKANHAEAKPGLTRNLFQNWQKKKEKANA